MVHVKPKILNLVFHASPLSMQHLGVRSKTGWLGFWPREAFVLAGLMSVGLLSCSLVGFDLGVRAKTSWLWFRIRCPRELTFEL